MYFAKCTNQYFMTMKLEELITLKYTTMWSCNHSFTQQLPSSSSYFLKNILKNMLHATSIPYHIERNKNTLEFRSTPKEKNVCCLNFQKSLLSMQDRKFLTFRLRFSKKLRSNLLYLIRVFSKQPTRLSSFLEFKYHFEFLYVQTQISIPAE